MVETFSSNLGWVAVVGCGRVVRFLTFGHFSAPAAQGAAEDHCCSRLTEASWHKDLAQRLRAFAGGASQDFSDILVDATRLTRFQHHVLKCCRGIPWGETLTYGQLACQVGRPRASRAVGRVMATNSVPLLVPCHRVVPARGGLGGFSGPFGRAMKRQLLRQEQVTLSEPTGKTHLAPKNFSSLDPLADWGIR